MDIESTGGDKGVVIMPRLSSGLLEDDDHDDDALSKLASSKLAISQTREIIKVDDTMMSFQLPKQLHTGLYINTLGDSAMVSAEKKGQGNNNTNNNCNDSSLKNTKNNSNQGVPGFADFPDSWTGEEGWAVWKRVDDSKTSSFKAQRRQKAEQIQQAHNLASLQRLKRKAVNVMGLSGRKPPPPPPRKTTTGYKTNTKVVKAHKMDRRRKLLQQLKQRREMVSLRKSLKALKCK